MNRNETILYNRSQMDSAIQALLLDTREIVCDLVKPLADHGEILPGEHPKQ